MIIILAIFANFRRFFPIFANKKIFFKFLPAQSRVAKLSATPSFEKNRKFGNFQYH
jgi:hypothetical protein